MECETNEMYTSCFCEENVYLLAKKMMQNENLNLFVLFISSKCKAVPIWNQKLAQSNDAPVVWDYHVVLYSKATHLDERGTIFDFDSTLGFKTGAEQYILDSFRPHFNIKEEYKQLLRTIPAQEFVDHFASDRSHMDPDKTPFPSWPLIRGKLAATSMNLFEYVEMNELGPASRTELGTVYDLDAFLAWIQ